MATKLEKILDEVQGNAYPAMLDDLSTHLGVSAESLRRLAPGWMPVVQFKKGPNFQGWWVIPERDADGDPIGLSLRAQNDTKVMYPGSKHGLVYEVNPGHVRGERGYNAGPSNWVRTMDAGVPCAVCGKPDGCLHSAEDAADPKAAICIRKKSGAVRPMKFGYLHVLKDQGNLNQTGALANNGGPVLIVEGASDAAAALDLGFDAVGRPSNLACMDLLCQLVKGRDCIVIGENDKKIEPGGVERFPGRDGMIAAFQTIKRVCRDVKMVMPPEHVKDLRAWRVKYGLTKAAFLEYAATTGVERVDGTVLADDRPTTIARGYLDSEFKLNNRYTLRRWEGTWYKYAGAKYSQLKNEAFLQPIYQWAYDKQFQRTDPKGNVTLVPLTANTALIANMTQAVAAETLIPDTELPCWINGRKGPPTNNLIVFSNGILNVNAFLDGANDALLDSTPDLFTTAALPFGFDPTASCPTWLAFLKASLGDEQAKIDLLQEWIGYCLTTDTSFQKLMYLRGPTGAGKGRVLEVLCDLVGQEQAADTSFSSLSGEFGLAPLVGKLVCTIGDARVPRHGDAMRGLELLLNISGNDGVQVNRKFKDQLERHRLLCRITIASNDILDVPDHSGALLRRLNYIEFTQSFVGREDFHLPDKLRAETSGIAVWALAGLRRLRDQGKFTLPESSRKAMSEWKTATSPVAAFLSECCDEAERKTVTKAELYDAWNRWSVERKVFPLPTQRFFERVRANAPHVSASEDKFSGVALKEWAAKKYLGRP